MTVIINLDRHTNIIDVEAHIPPTTTSLQLMGNSSTITIPIADIINLISKLHMLKSLELKDIKDIYLGAEGLINILKSTSQTVTCLKLTRMSIAVYDVYLDDVAKAIPSRIKTLDLSDSDFSYASPEGYTRFLSNTPESVEELNLRGNTLYELTDECLHDFLKAIRPSVKILHLSELPLSSTGLTYSQAAFESFPPTVTTLYLHDNCEAGELVPALNHALDTFPTTIKHLVASTGFGLEKASAEVLSDIIPKLARFSKPTDTPQTHLSTKCHHILLHDGIASIFNAKLSKDEREQILDIAAKLVGLEPDVLEKKLANLPSASTPQSSQHCFAKSKDTLFNGGGGAAEKSGGKHQRDASDDQSTDPKDKRSKSSP